MPPVYRNVVFVQRDGPAQPKEINHGRTQTTDDIHQGGVRVKACRRPSCPLHGWSRQARRYRANAARLADQCHIAWAAHLAATTRAERNRIDAEVVLP